MTVLRTLTLNGTTYEVESSHASIHTITLSASKWIGSGSKYSQVVSIPGITTKTKVDIQPTEDLLALLYLASFGKGRGPQNGAPGPPWAVLRRSVDFSLRNSSLCSPHPSRLTPCHLPRGRL